MSQQMGVYTEVAKLVGTGVTGSKSNQGYSVKLSEDGNSLFVGGYRDNNYVGAAWFYQKIDSVWTQKQKIIPTGYIGYPYFGWSIDVNPSMNTLIVGAYYENSQVGASYVFTFDGTTWTQQGNKLVGSGYAGGSWQGVAVGLSADGNTAIVGGSKDANNMGAVWIFVRTGTTWSQQGSKLVGSGTYGSTVYQGAAVAITSDGNLAIFSASSNSANQAAIWTFVRSNGVWSQVGSKILAAGWSLALSGDDQTLVEGGGYKYATIYKRSGNTFTKFGKVGGFSTNSWSVAVNKDGTIVAVGTPGDTKSFVWTYYFNGTQYTQFGTEIVATDAIGSASQGFPVSLDGAASQLLYGGYTDNDGIGAAWIYKASPSAAPTKQPSLGPTKQPSIAPTKQPSFAPGTKQPSLRPTTKPSAGPTAKPLLTPVTKQPSFEATERPSVGPTAKPLLAPVTEQPSFEATERPSLGATTQPSIGATRLPTISAAPVSKSSSSSHGMSRSSVIAIAFLVPMLAIALLIVLWKMCCKSDTESVKAMKVPFAVASDPL